MRDLLRGLPVLAHSMPDFDVEAAPPEPAELFTNWLTEAIAAGVAEPHAMTLSTVDADGQPDARVLILKDLDAEGNLSFATTSTSVKGRHVAANPRVALSFHWREQGRQIRVRGIARRADPAVSRQDFLARPEGSRVASLVGRQSEVLTDRAELTGALAAARTRTAADPTVAPDTHVVYAVHPDTVEFWQADRQREHIRLRYRRAADTGDWVRELLWP
ncbi:pyridoxine/pyridoxamine 5'-phosphate oxidase [Micromonospora sp. NPDC003197]